VRERSEDKPKAGLLRRLLRLHRDDRAAGVWLQLTEFMLEQCCVRHGGFQEAVDFLADCVEGRASLPGEDAAVHRAQTDRSAVQILTMHKSKGLEARAVVLFGGFTRWRADCIHRFVHDGGRRFWLGRKPSARLAPRVDRETREEDQRLLYVALTRAQAQLILPVYHTGGGVACVGFDRATADPQGAYGAVNHRLRALLPDVPVLLVTGRADQATHDLAARHSGVTLLAKPFGLRDLQQYLDACGRRDPA